MASGPITSWQIDGETMETVKDFIFGGSKITIDGDFSQEIKWCFQAVVPEKTLESPWVEKRSNQSILKEIIPEYSLEELKLKHQYFGRWCKELTHWKRPWFWERLRIREGGNRWWDCWMASPTQWTWVWANSRRYWRTGKPGVLQSMGQQRVRHGLVTEQQQMNNVFARKPCSQTGNTNVKKKKKKRYSGKPNNTSIFQT